MEPTIRTHNLQRQYRMGDEIIHALRGVDLTVQRGPGNLAKLSA